MRIQNNITALNAHRQYGINNAGISKSVEKLSSGYRINRAGDDAAGLAISEKMRAQIKGLNMASKNSQDAISLVQTAEGALQESHNILQRMRELAVQSASDTNETSIDRGALQKEFAQLIKEIDDTATKTKFNDQGLIDGTFASTKTTAVATSGDKLGLAWAADRHSDNATFTIKFAEKEVVAKNDGMSTTAVSVGDIKATATNGTIGVSHAPGAGVMDSSMNGIWDLSIVEKDGIMKAVAINSSNGKVIEAVISGISSTSSPITVDLGALGKLTVSSSAIVSSSDFKTLAGQIKVTGGVDKVDAQYEYVAELLDEDENKLDEIVVQTGQSMLNFNSGGISVQLTDVIAVNKTSTTASDDAKTMTKDFGGEIKVNKNSGKDLVIQTGANQGDSLGINLSDMSSYSLGIAASAINNRANAQVAITQVNTALNIVSTQRAALGALQNRLDHKIANLDTSAENLTAAESRIRDVDMAKQMTEFTKQNILSQASTAMLAQANALPQGVLQLLG